MSHCEQRRCKACGGSWSEDRDIATQFYEENRAMYPTRESAEAAAEMFGWTKENQLCAGKNVVGIQYSHRNPNHYDGVSEWHCMLCKARIGRWTGKILSDGEWEPRFGGGI